MISNFKLQDTKALTIIAETVSWIHKLNGFKIILHLQVLIELKLDKGSMWNVNLMSQTTDIDPVTSIFLLVAQFSYTKNVIALTKNFVTYLTIWLDVSDFYGKQKGALSCFYEHAATGN